MTQLCRIWCVVLVGMGSVLSGCSLSLHITDKLASLIPLTPQATLSSTTAVNTNLSQWSVDVQFNTPVTNVDVSYFDLQNGTISNIQKISDLQYRLVLSPVSDGNVSIQLRADSVQTGILASNVLNFISDQTAPSMNITYTGNNPTNVSPLQFTVTFSETVSGQPSGADFSISGGTVDQISGNGTVFTVDVVPSANGTLSISYGAGKISDLSGNLNLASNSVSVAYNNDRPVPTLSSVTTGNHVNTAVVVDVSFSASVTGFTAGDLEVTNAVVSNFSGSGDTYSFTLTPIAEGDFKVRVVADAAQDASTNLSIASSWLQKKYDSVRPTVTLSNLASYTKTTSDVSVTATFSEAVTGFDISVLSLTNATAVITGSGSTYTITLTPQGEGAFSVSIPENAVTDLAGNGVQASNTASSIRDTVPPTITITSDVGPYSYTSPISFTLVFSEPVTDLTLADFVVTGELSSKLGTLIGFGSVWTVQLTPTTNGTKTLNLPANKVIDAAGFNNVASNTESVYYDTTAVPVTFLQREQTALESDGMAKFQLRMAGTKPYPVTINYRMMGDAVYGVDHDLPTEGSITIPANSANPTIVDIPFNVLHNSATKNKFIQMNLHYTSSPLIRFGADYQSRIFISDTDAVHGSVQDFSISEYTRCFVLSTGRLRCWGVNSYGSVGDGTLTRRLTAVDVDSGNSYQKVASLNYLTCGLRTNGDVYCWGISNNQQLGSLTIPYTSLTPVYLGSGFSDIAIDTRAICGLSGGDIYCWGKGLYGEVGNGSLTGASLTPINITSDTTSYPNNFVSIKARGGSLCALTDIGSLYCWGDNIAVPTLVTTPAFKSFSMGGVTCGIDMNDSLYCWGANSVGQVGDGTTTNRTTPTLIDSANKYSYVGLGVNHGCAVRKTTQRVVCWGQNQTGTFDAGAIGDGSDYTTVSTDKYKTSPTLTKDTTTYLRVEGGYNYSCGVTTDQKIKCWGSYQRLGVGDGFESQRLDLAESDMGATYKQISVNTNFACGIDSNDRLKCWGKSSTAFSIGDGTLANVIRPSPIVLDRGLTYKSVSVGYQHACAIRTDDGIKCWGYNSSGGLGVGSLVGQAATPIAVDGGVSYKKISVGAGITCGITTANVLKCWGLDSNGQLGNGAAGMSNVPVEIDPGVHYTDIAVSPRDESHTCGITENKILKCWGKNDYGQLGLGATSAAMVSPQVVSATDLYSAVAVGTNFTCAIRDGSGALYCWGQSSEYQTGLNTTTTQLSPQLVDAGTSYSSVTASTWGACGKSSVGYKCWGSVVSSAGILVSTGVSTIKVPSLIPNASDFTELSFSALTGIAGNANSYGCTIANDGKLYCFGPGTAGMLAHGGTFPSWLGPIEVTGWIVE